MQNKSPTYLKALQMLPPELVPILDNLIEHYKFAALKHHGKALVSSIVIAELVLIGWRDVADPIKPIEIIEPTLGATKSSSPQHN